MTANITLDQIIAASKTSGVSIADIIIGIDAGLSGSVKASKPAQTTPKAKTAKKARKTADKSDSPILIATKNGGMMDSRPGTVTKGQIAKLVTLCDKMGEPLTKDELKIIASYSMAAASDYRFDLIADSNA